MKNLRYWRRVRLLNQAELAALVGVNVATVGEWERGEAEPRIAHLRKLCQALNVSADALIGTPEDYEGKAAAVGFEASTAA